MPNTNSNHFRKREKVYNEQTYESDIGSCKAALR